MYVEANKPNLRLLVKCGCLRSKLVGIVHINSYMFGLLKAVVHSEASDKLRVQIIEHNFRPPPLLPFILLTGSRSLDVENCKGICLGEGVEVG
jgi:hypothetical protein